MQAIPGINSLWVLSTLYKSGPQGVGEQKKKKKILVSEARFLNIQVGKAKFSSHSL